MEAKVSQARGRLLRHMNRVDGPVTVRDAHRRMSNTIATEERWQLIRSMIECGDVAHKDGVLTLVTSEIPAPAKSVRYTELPNSSDLD